MLKEILTEMNASAEALELKMARVVGERVAKKMIDTEKEVYQDMVDDDPDMKVKFPTFGKWINSLAKDDAALDEFADRYLDDIHVQVKKSVKKMAKTFK